MQNKKIKILAVSSDGGHWIQLKKVLPAFLDNIASFATINIKRKKEVDFRNFYVVKDANRWNKFGLIILAFQMFKIILKERPNFVISTGAAPGFFGIVFGKMFGANTIWIDSVANVNKLSMCGKYVGKFSDLWLTQWPNVADNKGPICRGRLI